MSTNTAFIEELLRRVPDVKPIYDEHVADNDTLLPHVFLGDVSRFVVAEANKGLCPAAIAVLEHLDEGLGIGSEEVKELIVVSFVENLIGETTALKALNTVMRPRLKAQVKRICG